MKSSDVKAAVGARYGKTKIRNIKTELSKLQKITKGKNPISMISKEERDIIWKCRDVLSDTQPGLFSFFFIYIF